jgi:hypothetical protein
MGDPIDVWSMAPFCDVCDMHTPSCIFAGCQHSYCWWCVMLFTACPRCEDPTSICAPIHRIPRLRE